jgi:ubiquinone/menaquinone biosynthesis C-methylase UbiE
MAYIFDDEFSRMEHEGWSRVSSLYDSSWAQLTTQFIDPLLDAADVQPGLQVLDVACGPGYVSQHIHQRKAIPTGLDFSASMIALARKSYPQIKFVEGDAQQLMVPDASFERIVMNFGLLHLIKPEQAISEAFRALKSKGTYAFTVWAGPDLSPMANVMNEVLTQYADQTVSMPESPPYDLFSDEQLCREVLTKIGFDAIQFNTRVVAWRVPSADYYFETELHAGVRTSAFLKKQTSHVLEGIKHAVRERMEEFYDGEAYVLKFCGCIISGIKN